MDRESSVVGESKIPRWFRAVESHPNVAESATLGWGTENIPRGIGSWNPTFRNARNAGHPPVYFRRESWSPILTTERLEVSPACFVRNRQGWDLG